MTAKRRPKPKPKTAVVARPPGGRTSLLTREVQDNVARALSAGADFYVAAEAYGVDGQTAHRWYEFGSREQRCHVGSKEAGRCADAEAGRPHVAGACPELARYREFRDVVDRARASSEVTFVALVATAARTDWRAALAILRAKWPERWNPVQRTEISGPGGGPVELAPARERLERQLAAIGTGTTSREDTEPPPPIMPLPPRDARDDPAGT